MYYLVSKELQHHGIKGQHWGERRYQNPDGSYTEEGRKRYGIGANGKATTEGLGQFVRDKYGSDGSLKGNLSAARKAKAESKEYEKDYRQQMANRVKTKESKQDVHNRLREKYGDLEYQTFEMFRKDRNKGKKLLAAGVAALAVSGLAVGLKLSNEHKEDSALKDAKALLNRNRGTMKGALGDKAYYTSREKMNRMFNEMNDYEKKHKKSSWGKAYSNDHDAVKNLIYDKAIANTESMNSMRREKNSTYGPRMGAQMRSQGQVMRYAPKSNNFTRSSNGLRRKYNPSWY